MNVSYSDRMGFGTNTAAIATGGQPPIAALTEVWNGTNWTEVNDLNAARYQGSASGKLYTAGLVFGGTGPPEATEIHNSTELWNGTNWTEVNNLGTARYSLGGGGTQTSATAFGGKGAPGIIAVTETWNGTNWTEVGDLPTAKFKQGGAGANNTAALSFGGGTDPDTLVTTTEEFNSGPTVATLTS